MKKFFSYFAFVILAVVEIIMTGYALFLSCLVPFIVTAIICFICYFFVENHVLTIILRVLSTIAIVISGAIYGRLRNEGFWNNPDKELPPASSALVLAVMLIGLLYIWDIGEIRIILDSFERY